MMNDHKPLLDLSGLTADRIEAVPADSLNSTPSDHDMLKLGASYECDCLDCEK